MRCGWFGVARVKQRRLLHPSFHSQRRFGVEDWVSGKVAILRLWRIVVLTCLGDTAAAWDRIEKGGVGLGRERPLGGVWVLVVEDLYWVVGGQQLRASLSVDSPRRSVPLDKISHHRPS